MMTKDRFDEYGHYGENNPPLGPTPQKNDNFFVEFVRERELPNGEVVMTFDLGPEATKAASELGLKLLMYMGALNISSEEAFTILWASRTEETNQ
jgi:hypothetical protein